MGIADGGRSRGQGATVSADPAWIRSETAVRRCGVVAAWVAAWLAGDVPADSATGAFGSALIDGLPGSPQGVGPLWAMQALRRGGAVGLAVPAPGDLRGLPAGPGAAAVRRAALDAGAALVAPGLALVPRTGVGDGTRWLALAWSVRTVAAPDPTTDLSGSAGNEPWTPETVSLWEADQALAEATREAARVFSALTLADPGARASREYAAMAASHAYRPPADLPPDHDPRAVALLARADALSGVLHAADRATDRLTQTSGQRVALTEALRAPAAAVRDARRAAYQARSGSTGTAREARRADAPHSGAPHSDVPHADRQ